MGHGPKKPKAFGGFPSQKKTPREEPPPLADKKPAWRLGRIDFGGPWCPMGLDQATLTEITKKLGGFEGSEWPEIEKGGSHFVAPNKIITVAQRRFAELRLDTRADELFSLRLSAKERIWGLRKQNVFSALWWDPEHAICPSVLKHT